MSRNTHASSPSRERLPPNLVHVGSNPKKGSASACKLPRPTGLLEVGVCCWVRVSCLVTSNQATTPPPIINAVLTHESERVELNVKPKPDLKPEEDCQTDPQRSTSEAEGDGAFDAAAIVMRVDTDRDLEEH